MADDQIIPGERVGTINIPPDFHYSALVISCEVDVSRFVGIDVANDHVTVPVYQWDGISEGQSFWVSDSPSPLALR